MFNNNTVIIELYEKISLYEELKEKIYDRRKFYYSTICVISFVAMFIFGYRLAESIVNFTLTIIYGLIAGMSSLALFEIITLKEDMFSFVWPISNKLLKQNKQEIIEYIKQDSVQIEILDFAKNHSNINLFKLKKSFALNNYDESFTMLFDFLGQLRLAYENIEAKAKLEKLVNDYELNIRMKL